MNTLSEFYIINHVIRKQQTNILLSYTILYNSASDNIHEQ